MRPSFSLGLARRHDAPVAPQTTVRFGATIAFLQWRWADLPCANPAADPCLLSSTATIPVGVYDIRPKSLSVANNTITVSGAGEWP